MEVLRRYPRARTVTRGHVCPANRPVSVCRQCPCVPVRALADVPVSYPRRVVCSHDIQRRFSVIVPGDERPRASAGSRSSRYALCRANRSITGRHCTEPSLHIDAGRESHRIREQPRLPKSRGPVEDQCRAVAITGAAKLLLDERHFGVPPTDCRTRLRLVRQHWERGGSPV